jgi:dynein heavy chain
VPAIWADKGFLSLKPLASWIIDCNDRVNFLTDWYQNGTPNVYWISGFFFPQAFLTGTLQNYARKHVLAIDTISFAYVLKDDQTWEDVKAKPEAGCLIYGMYLEGCRWDYQQHCLNESEAKKLFVDLPMVHLVPVQNRKVPEEDIYFAPIYKVLSRTGTLLTTGHSTNFVLYIELPSKED